MLIPLSFKWNRQCAYCGAKEVPLQVEHIQPRAKGGTNRVSNLTLACEPCNRKKGTQDIREFLLRNSDVLGKVLAQVKAPLKEAAAVNATRWELYRCLQALGLPVEGGSGGRTKFNRTSRHLAKTHWLDAACVGASTPAALYIKDVHPLLIKAMGHGSRQMCRMNRYGFPRTGPKARQKSYLGFQTGDMVKAIVPSGKHQGTHIGRLAIRFRPSFCLNGFDIHPKYLRMLYHNDGYSYEKEEAHSPLV